jgi:hypothetical protein
MGLPDFGLGPNVGHHHSRVALAQDVKDLQAHRRRDLELFGFTGAPCEARQRRFGLPDLPSEPVVAGVQGFNPATLSSIRCPHTWWVLVRGTRDRKVLAGVA